MKRPTEFTVNVIRLIAAIPKGKVATYGQIAKLAGKPQGARGVSWILSSSTETHGLPWHRVLGAGGKIAFPPGSPWFARQKRFLKAEGVEFTEPGRVDLNVYGWKKRAPKAKRAGPRMFGV